MDLSGNLFFKITISFVVPFVISELMTLSINPHTPIHSFFLMCTQVWAAVYKETRPFLPKCKLKLFQRNSQLRPTSPGAGRGGPQVQVETLLMEKGLHVA